MALVVNAGLRDTDAWQKARGAAVAQWAALMDTTPWDARRALVFIRSPRGGEPEALRQLMDDLRDELVLSAE